MQEQILFYVQEIKLDFIINDAIVGKIDSNGRDVAVVNTTINNTTIGATTASATGAFTRNCC